MATENKVKDAGKTEVKIPEDAPSRMAFMENSQTIRRIAIEQAKTCPYEKLPEGHEFVGLAGGFPNLFESIHQMKTGASWVRLERAARVATGFPQTPGDCKYSYCFVCEKTGVTVAGHIYPCDLGEPPATAPVSSLHRCDKCGMFFAVTPARRGVTFHTTRHECQEEVKKTSS
jgi:hypothetical protein